MKKRIAIAALVIFSFPVFSETGLALKTTGSPVNDTDVASVLTTADDDNGVKGKFILTAGAGFNFSGLNYRFRYASTYYFQYMDGSSILSVKSIPMLNFMADYGIGKRVTVGIAAGYQTSTVTWTDDYHPEVIDKWTRIHAAVRGDYWIVAEENIGVYTGLKLGYNSYRLSSTTFKPDPWSQQKVGYIYPSAVSVQAHFGFNYWFSGVIGLNAEMGLGFGGPYVCAAGITAKF